MSILPTVNRRSPLLELGFRPFFLLAALAAVLLVLYWQFAYTTGALKNHYYGPFLWHGHEMLFGYTAAVVAGFLLTAIRHWTRIPTAHGTALGVLALLWLGGRVAPFSPLPGWLIALVDMGFLPLLTVYLAVPLVRARQYRNLVFIPILLGFSVANLLVHAQQLGFMNDVADLGIKLALDMVVLLIVIMGGRVIPFFIERGTGGETKPRVWPVIEMLSWISLLAYVATDLAVEPAIWTSALAVFAAVVQLIRLVGWHVRALWRIPMLWILYLAYAWIPAGLLLAGLVDLGMVKPGLAIHAFAVGGIGMMTVGMMARVTLGHTGREIRHTRVLLAAFVLIGLAAWVRVVLPLVAPTVDYPQVITSASWLWSGGFVLFLWVVAPKLLSPRIDGLSGLRVG